MGRPSGQSGTVFYPVSPRLAQLIEALRRATGQTPAQITEEAFCLLLQRSAGMQQDQPTARRRAKVIVLNGPRALAHKQPRNERGQFMAKPRGGTGAERQA